MRDFEPQIRNAGANVAAVGLGNSYYASTFRDESGITFPLLVDKQRQAYRAAGLRAASLSHLLRRDNLAARNRAKSAGHRQHRLGKDPLQLGGSFVFAPGDEDLYVHLSETFGDNADLAEVVAALPGQS